jgi:hypothetical protein
MVCGLKIVSLNLCHSDLRHAPGVALLLQLLYRPNAAVEAFMQPEAQWACGIGAEGCDVAAADSPNPATA